MTQTLFDELKGTREELTRCYSGISTILFDGEDTVVVQLSTLELSTRGRIPTPSKVAGDYYNKLSIALSALSQVCKSKQLNEKYDVSRNTVIISRK